MKTTYKFILLFVLAFATSCSEYLDINQSPNDPQASDVTPDLILAGALTSSHRTQARTMNILGNVMMNNWGANVNSFTGGFSEEFSLAIDNNFYSGIFTGLYLNNANFQAIIDFEDNSYSNHKAISKIMKTYYFQYIVDLYGDAPYTEALKGIDNTTPSYDDDQFIYRQLITELDAAIAMIQGANAATVNVGNEDVVFNGSMANWIAFANTIKLRILLRESTKAYGGGDRSLPGDAASAAYLDTQFAALSGSSFVTGDVKINPGYSSDEVAQQNPFYGLFFSNNETTSVSNNFYRGTDHAIEFLKGNLPESTPDPRLGSIYASTDTMGFVGHVQGADGNNSPSELSAIGTGLVKSSSQNGIIMTGAESLLMQAEAQLYTKISGSDVASFNAAIESSLAFHGATGYTPGTIIGLGWAGSNEDKLKAIMRQKWIATNGINAIESYIEYTRTGYPNNIPLALTAQRSDRPKRLLYPSSELTSNASNVPAVSSDQAFATGPFWAQ